MEKNTIKAEYHKGSSVHQYLISEIEKGVLWPRAHLTSAFEESQRKNIRSCKTGKQLYRTKIQSLFMDKISDSEIIHSSWTSIEMCLLRRMSLLRKIGLPFRNESPPYKLALTVEISLPHRTLSCRWAYCLSSLQQELHEFYLKVSLFF